MLVMMSMVINIILIMMITGSDDMDINYDIVFDTPQGKLEGYLIFMIENQALNGVLNVGKAHTSFFGGNFDDQSFNFEGRIYYHYLHLNYRVHGRWSGNQIQGSLFIRKLEFKFNGYQKTSAG